MGLRCLTGALKCAILAHIPFWFQPSTSNRYPQRNLTPLIPKNTVESTQRRKAAKTQGFRLVGSFTRWVSKVFSPHLPSPGGFGSWVFALAAVSRLFNPCMLLLARAAFSRKDELHSCLRLVLGRREALKELVADNRVLRATSIPEQSHAV